MAEDPTTEAERAVARTIENIKRLAHGIGAEFTPDPEKVRAYIAAYPATRDRARAAVAQSRKRLAD